MALGPSQAGLGGQVARVGRTVAVTPGWGLRTAWVTNTTLLPTMPGLCAGSGHSWGPEMRVWHRHGSRVPGGEPPRGLGGAREPLVGEAKAGRSGCPGGCASEKGVTEGTPDTNMKKGKETPSKVQWVQVRGKEL